MNGRKERERKKKKRGHLQEQNIELLHENQFQAEIKL